jgi:hypothetical protein
MANGIPLALLSARYKHVADRGAKPSEDQYAMLVFHPSRSTFLLVEPRGGKLKAYEGTFFYRGGKLHLSFASKGFQRSVTTPLDLAAAEVTLPFRMFSAGGGTSTWRRDDSADRIFDIAGDLCIGVVRTRKLDPKATDPFLEKYLELFVHPKGTPEVDVRPAPRILSMTSFRITEGAMAVDVEDWGRRISGAFGHACFMEE